MAQSLQIKKINSLPSTFEKGTVYFYPAQKQILLGLGSGSTEGTHYVVFKGTDTVGTNHTVSASGTAPLVLSASNSGTTTTLTGSINTAGAASLGVVQGFHRTSGTASGTRTTNASNAPSVNTRSTTTGRYYGVETDSVGKMFVNVPWTDTHVSVSELSESDSIYIAGPTLLTSPATSSSLKANTKVYVTALSQVYASGGFYESSDERLKNFEDDITVDFDKLKSIKKAYFRWKADPKELNIGVSAQSLQSIYPELVTKNNDGMLSVTYDKLAVIALSAVDLLDDRYKALENKNKELEERLSKLENLIKSM